MQLETLLVEKKGNICIITLNRPEKLNALNNTMFKELDNTFVDIEMDPEVLAVIITGAGGKAFAAGADISELHGCDERSGKIFSEYGSYVFRRIEDMRIPVIAAINGYALGGGCELTLACHLRYASDNLKIGQPEVNLGIIPGYGGTQRLARIIGKAKAIELIITGNTIDANEAKRIGLVNDVFLLPELLEKVESIAELIVSKGPKAVRAAMETINASEKLSPMEGLLFESLKFGEVCGTYDFKEGTLAFLEKRKPAFKNA